MRLLAYMGFYAPCMALYFLIYNILLHNVNYNMCLWLCICLLFAFYVYLCSLACKIPFMVFVWAFCGFLCSVFALWATCCIFELLQDIRKPRRAQTIHQERTPNHTPNQGAAVAQRTHAKGTQRKAPHMAHIFAFACSIYIFFNVQKHARRNRTHNPQRANHPRKKGSI